MAKIASTHENVNKFFLGYRCNLPLWIGFFSDLDVSFANYAVNLDGFTAKDRKELAKDHKGSATFLYQRREQRRYRSALPFFELMSLLFALGVLVIVAQQRLREQQSRH